MTRLFAATLLAAAVGLPVAAHADGADGSRMPAGGNHMSSYVDHPNHDPRSSWSQQNRTGQILGQPMLSENAGAPVVRRGSVQRPYWAVGRGEGRWAR